MPIILAPKLYFKIVMVAFDALFHSPRKTERRSAWSLVTIINMAQPILAVILPVKEPWYRPHKYAYVTSKE